jgi:hypothetical protein
MKEAVKLKQHERSCKDCRKEGDKHIPCDVAKPFWRDFWAAMNLPIPEYQKEAGVEGEP